jgi:hypothetical protein
LAYPVFAQDKAKPPQKSDENLLEIKREYGFLKEQTKSYREFIEKERKQHQEFLEWSLGWLVKAIGIIVAIFVALVGIFGIKSIYDAKKKISDLVREKFNDYISNNTDEIEIKIQHIAEKVIQEKINLKKKILMLVPETLQEAASEINFLWKRGFKNIEVKGTDYYSIDCELIVFYYDPEQNNNLIDLVKKLKKASTPKPLIIYYSGRVEDNELKKELRDYKWHTFANNPLTLTNWVFSTLEIVSTLKI